MPKQRVATTRDVAQHAGVSYATVSVVLNGSRSTTRVSPETRQRIIAAATELGYAPNPLAQALRRQRSQLLGFVPRTERTNPYEQPIPYLLAIYLERAALRRGYRIVAANSEPGSLLQADACFAFLRSQHVDGVIFDWPESAQLVQQVADHGVPVVQLVRPVAAVDTATVTVDATQGVTAAVDHLVALGHRDIAFLGQGGSHPIDQARLSCFLDALQRHAITIPDTHVHLGEHYAPAEGYAFTKQLLALSNRPTTIFAAGDSLALGALRALYEARVRVPDDISLVSYDDAFAAHLYPPLTSVSQPLEEVAEQALVLLEAQLEGEPGVVPPAHQVLPTQLHVRASTAAPPFMPMQWED